MCGIDLFHVFNTSSYSVSTDRWVILLTDKYNLFNLFSCSVSIGRSRVNLLHYKFNSVNCFSSAIHADSLASISSYLRAFKRNLNSSIALRAKSM